LIKFTFLIDQVGLLDFHLNQPVLNEKKSAWICVVEWNGVSKGSSNVFGVSSLQSGSLAIDFIRTELSAAYPLKAISELGVPLV